MPLMHVCVSFIVFFFALLHMQMTPSQCHWLSIHFSLFFFFFVSHEKIKWKKQLFGKYVCYGFSYVWVCRPDSMSHQLFFLICFFLFVLFSLSQWELNSLVYVQCMWMRIVCVVYECFVFDSVSFCDSDSWRSVIINWFMWIQFEFWADSGFNCCAVCGKSLNHICLYGECNLRYCITKEGPPPTTGIE